jgi:hypothetical protein
MACQFPRATTLKVEATVEERCIRCQSFLQSLFLSFVGGSHVSKVSIGEDIVQLETNDGTVRISARRAALRKELELVCPGICSGQGLRFGELLVALYDAAQSLGRRGSKGRVLAAAVFRCLVDGLTTEVEASAHSDSWKDAELFALAPLVNTQDKGKARRTGSAQQIAVLQAVREEPGVRTPQQFLASVRIWSRRNKGASSKQKLKRRQPRHRGSGFSEARCGQYLRTGHRDLQRTKHYWYSTDGVRAGNGLDLMITPVGDAMKMLHAWSAPQVEG